MANAAQAQAGLTTPCLNHQIVEHGREWRPAALLAEGLVRTDRGQQWRALGLVRKQGILAGQHDTGVPREGTVVLSTRKSDSHQDVASLMSTNMISGGGSAFGQCIKPSNGGNTVQPTFFSRVSAVRGIVCCHHMT